MPGLITVQTWGAGCSKEARPQPAAIGTIVAHASDVAAISSVVYQLEEAASILPILQLNDLTLERSTARARRTGLFGVRFDRHLRRPIQKVLAEIFQNLPRGQKQAVALIRFDGQRHHGWLVGIRDQLVGPDRIGRQFLFVGCRSPGHQVSSLARFTSGGVASSSNAAIASAVGITVCPSLPRRRIETECVSASFLPTTSSAGIFASECSRTL